MRPDPGAGIPELSPERAAEMREYTERLIRQSRERPDRAAPAHPRERQRQLARRDEALRMERMKREREEERQRTWEEALALSIRDRDAPPMRPPKKRANLADFRRPPSVYQIDSPQAEEMGMETETETETETEDVAMGESGPSPPPAPPRQAIVPLRAPRGGRRPAGPPRPEPPGPNVTPRELRAFLRDLIAYVIATWTAAVGHVNKPPKDQSAFLPPGMVEQLFYFVRDKPEGWGGEILATVDRYVRLLRTPIGINKMVRKRMLMFDFARVSVMIIKSPRFQEYLHAVWKREHIHNLNMSYVAFILDPRLSWYDESQVPGASPEQGYPIVAMQFWIVASADATGTVTHNFRRLTPVTFPSNEIETFLHGISRAFTTIPYEGGVLRVPPAREIIVFDVAKSREFIAAGGMPAFRTQRISGRASFATKFSALHHNNWREYNQLDPPAPPGALEEAEDAPRRLAPTPPARLPRIAPPSSAPTDFSEVEVAENPSDDPNPMYARSIARNTLRDMRARVIRRITEIWNTRALGRPRGMEPQKLPPIGLLRFYLWKISRNRADQANDKSDFYVRIIARNPILRHLVMRDMVVFDGGNELMSLMQEPYILEDLMGLQRNVPVPSGRFIVFTMRNSFQLPSTSDATRLEGLEGRKALRLWTFDTAKFDNPPQMLTRLANPLIDVQDVPLILAQYGAMPEATRPYILAFGDPTTGPLYSRTRQVYRIAAPYSRLRQGSSGGLFGEWQYYERAAPEDAQT